MLSSPGFVNQYMPRTSTVSGAQIVNDMVSLEKENGGSGHEISAVAAIIIIIVRHRLKGSKYFANKEMEGTLPDLNFK
jgi:hypothetical protein